MGSLNVGPCFRSWTAGLEKDKMLVEKQKVINELTWKLQQEQRQVEELRLQLQKHKRSGCPDKKPPPFPAASIKQEDAVSSCPFLIPANSREKTEHRLGGPATAREDAQLLPLGSTLTVQSPRVRPTYCLPHSSACSAHHSILPSGCEKPTAHQFAPIAEQPLLPSPIIRRPRRRTQGLLTCQQPGVHCTGKNWPHVLFLKVRCEFATAKELTWNFAWGGLLKV